MKKHPLTPARPQLSLARLALVQTDGEILRLQGLVQAYSRALKAASPASLKKAKLRVALRRTKAQLRAAQRALHSARMRVPDHDGQAAQIQRRRRAA